MVSKSSRGGYGTKCLYECEKETKDDDPYASYDDDDECNAHDLTKEQLAHDLWAKEVIGYVLSHSSQM